MMYYYAYVNIQSQEASTSLGGDDKEIKKQTKDFLFFVY